jgi:hypothetical protein
VCQSLRSIAGATNLVLLFCGCNLYTPKPHLVFYILYKPGPDLPITRHSSRYSLPITAIRTPKSIRPATCQHPSHPSQQPCRRYFGRATPSLLRVPPHFLLARHALVQDVGARLKTAPECWVAAMEIALASELDGGSVGEGIIRGKPNGLDSTRHFAESGNLPRTVSEEGTSVEGACICLRAADSF